MIVMIDNCILSEHTLLFKEVMLRMTNRIDAQRIRDEARMGATQIFRRAIKTKMNENEEDLTQDWQVHHIIPVRFGGTNILENLALIDPSLHKMIHDIIGDQTRGMHTGDERKVKLPYMKGFVWGL